MSTTRLKDTTAQGRAEVANYGSAALLIEVPEDAEGPAQITGNSEATSGYWLLTFRRVSGPTSTDYSIKLGPGQDFSEEMPPKGAVWLLALSPPNGVLSWYLSYRSGD